MIGSGANRQPPVNTARLGLTQHLLSAAGAGYQTPWFSLSDKRQWWQLCCRTPYHKTSHSEKGTRSQHEEIVVTHQ